MKPKAFTRILGLWLAATLSAPAMADARPPAPAITHAAGSASALSAAQEVLRSSPTRAVYDLSSGHSMEVRVVRGAVHMRYGQRRAMVLRHDGQGNFVSADGRVGLQFEPAADGRPRAARLTVANDWL